MYFGQNDTDTFTVDYAALVARDGIPASVDKVITYAKSTAYNMQRRITAGQQYFSSYGDQAVARGINGLKEYYAALTDAAQNQGINLATQYKAKMDTISAITKDIQEKADVLSKWGPEVGDAYHKLQKDKNTAIITGDLDNPILSKEEKAKAIEIAYTRPETMGEEAAAAIRQNYSQDQAKTGNKNMLIAAGIAAVAAFLYFK